ncbi:MAG: ribokinase [Treponema sp.]|nr:ribokinase [Treponema sp.]
MKILVFGSINIDLTFFVDHLVTPGETIASTGLLKSAGGKGANQAAALAKAGLPVYMAGKIGADGEFLLTLLNSYGVNTDQVIRYEGATGQAIIQIDKNRQNGIFLFGGGNRAVTAEEIHAVIEVFDRGDLIVLQNEISHLGEIMKAAGRRGLRICFNPSPYTQAVEELPLDLVDLFFVNEIEGAAMASAPAEALPAVLDKLTGRFPRAEIILTAGKEGAYYGSGKIREQAAVLDVPVVDTVGAGDTFTGYFIAARCKNLSVGDAMRAASKAASLAVSRKGAMEAIPLAGEVF